MEILKACEIAGFSKKKRIQYDKDMYDEKRFYSELYTARREGIEEGMEKGKAEGRAEGRAEGKAEGRAEGKAEAIRTMISAGIPVETVASAFGMTVEECERL